MSADLLNRLQYSAVPWNMWRRDNPAVNVVLDGANLSGMILTGNDLSNAACATHVADDGRGNLSGCFHR